MNAETAQAIFAGLIIIWGIVQVVLSWRLAKTTSDLDHRVKLLNVELDQRIQRLYRMRDLLSKYEYFNGRMRAFTTEGVSEVLTMSGENAFDHAGNLASTLSELSGIVLVINDNDLNMLTTQLMDEMAQNGKSKVSVIMFKRIYELLEIATK